jgi:hypothetical protein
MPGFCGVSGEARQRNHCAVRTTRESDDAGGGGAVFHLNFVVAGACLLPLATRGVHLVVPGYNDVVPGGTGGGVNFF